MRWSTATGIQKFSKEQVTAQIREFMRYVSFLCNILNICYNRNINETNEKI